MTLKIYIDIDISFGANARQVMKKPASLMDLEKPLRFTFEKVMDIAS